MKKGKQASKATAAADATIPGAGVIRRAWIVAAAISAFLAYGSFTGKYLPGCDAGGNCADVLGSKWGYTFGVPVSVLGLLVYAAGLIALGKGKLTCERRSAVAAVSLIILASVAWFVAVQLLILKKFCPWCMAAHLAGATGAVLALRNIGFARMGAVPIWATAAAVGLMITGQKFGKAPAPLVGARMEQNSGAANREDGKPARELPLHGGQVVLNLNDVPITGSPTAPYILVSLFDYTCHVCRDLHGLLHQAYLVNSNKMAIVHLPNPLDGACNPLIRQTQQAHIGACEHAKVGLAVWQADPTKFDTYTQQVFGPAQPQPPKESERLGAELVGAEKLREKLNNPWSTNVLGTSSTLYKLNSQKVGTTKMPQIILGPKIYAGIFRADQLNAALREAGLQPILELH
ncbi:MAG TPA: vitamin K epoxide reductase family protein [Methylomirabilota bacterium]|nr:vitamin K epoxide reductase family protein [Methylomirabilota bacterium]